MIFGTRREYMLAFGVLLGLPTFGGCNGDAKYAKAQLLMDQKIQAYEDYTNELNSATNEAERLQAIENDRTGNYELELRRLGLSKEERSRLDEEYKKRKQEALAKLSRALASPSKQTDLPKPEKSLHSAPTNTPSD